MASNKAKSPELGTMGSDRGGIRHSPAGVIELAREQHLSIQEDGEVMDIDCKINGRA